MCKKLKCMHACKQLTCMWIATIILYSLLECLAEFRETPLRSSGRRTIPLRCLCSPLDWVPLKCLFEHWTSHQCWIRYSWCSFRICEMARREECSCQLSDRLRVLCGHFESRWPRHMDWRLSCWRMPAQQGWTDSCWYRPRFPPPGRCLLPEGSSRR